MIRVQDYPAGNTSPTRWTYGSQVMGNRYAGAYPDGTVNLHEWDGKQYLPVRTIKCRSYRRAVRVLRWQQCTEYRRVL